MRISNNYSNTLYTVKNNSNRNISDVSASSTPSFQGEPPKFIIPIVKWLEKGLFNLIDTKVAEKIVTRSAKKEELLASHNLRADEFNKMIDERIKQKNPNAHLSDKPNTLLAKKKSSFLFSNLIVLGSTIMSGFYVGKTLTNEKLSKERRRTLAINQGLVYGVSTAMAYTLDFWTNKKARQIRDDFALVNNEANQKPLAMLREQAKTLLPENFINSLEAKRSEYNSDKLNKDLGSLFSDVDKKGKFNHIMRDELKAITEKTGKILTGAKLDEFNLLAKTIKTVEHMKALDGGLSKGKSIIAIDTVYRFIAPVLVTPIANAIGNHMAEKKEAKKVQMA